MMHVKIYLFCLFIGFLITLAIGTLIDSNNDKKNENDHRI
jgi:hypothetical protein